MYNRGSNGGRGRIMKKSKVIEGINRDVGSGLMRLSGGGNIMG
jgi:hypothetical protein